MKWIIASDIHGSAHYARKLMEAFDREGADKMLLLGDLLYHGARNDLTMEYDTKAVFSMLNERKDSIMAVRGNCDSEVDQMVIEFPIMADYNVITVDGKNGPVNIYASHGHIYKPATPMPLVDGSVLINGHTHVPACVDCGGFTYMNPGSVSLPRDGSEHSYMIIEDGVCIWKNLEGVEYMRYEL